MKNILTLTATFLFVCSLSSQILYLDSINILDVNSDEKLERTEFGYNTENIGTSVKYVSFDNNMVYSEELISVDEYISDFRPKKISFSTIEDDLQRLEVDFTANYYGSDSTIVDFVFYDNEVVDYTGSFTRKFDEMGNDVLRSTKFSFDDGSSQVSSTQSYFNPMNRLDSTIQFYQENEEEKQILSKKYYTYDNENLSSVSRYISFGDGVFVLWNLLEYSNYDNGLYGLKKESSLNFITNEMELDYQDSITYINGLISEHFEIDFFDNGKKKTVYLYSNTSKEVNQLPYLNKMFNDLASIFDDEQMGNEFEFATMTNSGSMKLDNEEYYSFDNTTKTYQLNQVSTYHYNEHESVTSSVKYESKILELSPNPVVDRLMIKEPFEESNYFIYSMDGKIMKAGSLSSRSFIDVSNLSNGMYSIIFKSKNSSHIAKSKFVKVN